jgi:hypothetical protein
MNSLQNMSSMSYHASAPSPFNPAIIERSYRELAGVAISLFSDLDRLQQQAASATHGHALVAVLHLTTWHIMRRYL